MPIYDISLPISPSLVVWPGHPSIGVTHSSHLDRGDRSTVSRLDLSSHAGTHVDAPAHFVPGAAGVDVMDLNLLVGPSLVVHCLEVDVISTGVLESLSIPAGTERVLFRTRNSNIWARNEQAFDENYVGVTRDGAQWLIEHGIRLVGVDYFAVAPFDDLVVPHQILLGAGMIVVEGLDLSRIAPGIYRLVCLPLKIEDGDGAPARAILIGA
jgi:arylformamidase